MFHEMPLKLYFMKCSERKVSQYILALRTLFLQKTSGRLLLNLQFSSLQFKYSVKNAKSLSNFQGSTLLHLATTTATDKKVEFYLCNKRKIVVKLTMHQDSISFSISNAFSISKASLGKF